MDPTTKALIETIRATGYAVMVGADSDGNKVVEATDKETGERFVRKEGGSGRRPRVAQLSDKAPAQSRAGAFLCMDGGDS